MAPGKQLKTTNKISLLLILLIFLTVFVLYKQANSSIQDQPNRQFQSNSKFNSPVLALGIAHSCALANKKISCWGANREGQIEVPEALNKPVQLSAGAYHSCVIDQDSDEQNHLQIKRSVTCWGAGRSGKTGGFDYGQSHVPETVQNPIAISAGWYHTCAINEAMARKLSTIDQAIPVRKVICWGVKAGSALNFGQLNVPDTLQNPRLISAGAWHTCVVDDRGVSCWGADNDLAVNNALNANFGQAKPPVGLEDITAIASGDAHTCAIHQAQISCWGNNDLGQLNVPKDAINAHAISAGMNHTCTMGSKGVVCWGSNHSGELSAPKIAADHGLSLASGAMHNCVATDEEVDCWGANDFNQANSMTLKPLKETVVNISRYDMLTNTADLAVE